MSLSQCEHEFFRCDLGLTEKTSKRTNLDLTVHRNHAAFGITLHDYMASALANLLKPEALKGALNFGTRDVRQLRHVQVQAP